MNRAAGTAGNRRGWRSRPPGVRAQADPGRADFRARSLPQKAAVKAGDPCPKCGQKSRRARATREVIFTKRLQVVSLSPHRSVSTSCPSSAWTCGSTPRIRCGSRSLEDAALAAGDPRRSGIRGRMKLPASMCQVAHRLNDLDEVEEVAVKYRVTCSLHVTVDCCRNQRVFVPAVKTHKPASDPASVKDHGQILGVAIPRCAYPARITTTDKPGQRPPLHLIILAAVTRPVQ